MAYDKSNQSTSIIMDNKIGNINITIDLTKIPGARRMNITRGETTMDCVVLPIDNEMGIVCDAYEAKLPDGLPTMKFYSDVKLNLVGIAHKEIKWNMSHGLKPSYSSEMIERMSEEQMKAVPWCGNVKPWAAAHIKKDMEKAQKAAAEGDKYKNW